MAYATPAGSQATHTPTERCGEVSLEGSEATWPIRCRIAHASSKHAGVSIIPRQAFALFDRNAC